MSPDQRASWPHPGLVVLFGSGETSASGQRVWTWLLSQLPSPVRVAVLETPAGFELNSERVAGRVGEFLSERLRNHKPEITLVPARKRGTPFSPEEPGVVAPLLQNDVLFLGPGSPTYAVRQLQGSRAWHLILARHRLGAALVLASAASIAVGMRALPVYEIYKVGEDPHWKPGLDLFGAYGLRLVFVPHWNNNDGGAELDTSRCYMGRPRFKLLEESLPDDATVVGIDEHTALVFDLSCQVCRVLGRGAVTVLGGGFSQRFPSGASFDIAVLGPLRPPGSWPQIPAQIWQEALASHQERTITKPLEPPTEILDLIAAREQARRLRDWSQADALRAQIASAGWEVRDTADGPELVPLPEPDVHSRRQ